METRLIDGQFQVDENNLLIKYHEKKGVTDVIIPDFITGILGQAFLDCDNIISVTIPKNIREILDYTFLGCQNLKHVNFNEGLKKIEDYAFAECVSLTDVNLPSTLELIGCGAFKHCKSLKEIIIPKNVGYLGSYAFADCSNITKVTLPPKIKTVEVATFSGCKSLSNIEIPENIVSIYQYAFRDCTFLNNVELLGTLLEIHSTSFMDCNNLKTINIPIENRLHIFKTLDNPYYQVLILNTIISNKMSIDNDYLNFIKESKMYIILICIKNNFIGLLNYILKELDKLYTSEEIDLIMEQVRKKNIINIEATTMLLEYKNKNYGFKNILDTIDTEFDLGEFGKAIK